MMRRGRSPCRGPSVARQESARALAVFGRVLLNEMNPWGEHPGPRGSTTSTPVAPGLVRRDRRGSALRPPFSRLIRPPQRPGQSGRVSTRLAGAAIRSRHTATRCRQAHRVGVDAAGSRSPRCPRAQGAADRPPEHHRAAANGRLSLLGSGSARHTTSWLKTPWPVRHPLGTSVF